MYRLIIRPQAEIDLKDAREWYEIQLPGLGNSFLEAMELLLNSIRNAPLHFQIRHSKKVRVASVPGFPYSIHFVTENDRIVVLGFLHQKRNPKIWKKRI